MQITGDEILITAPAGFLKYNNIYYNLGLSIKDEMKYIHDKSQLQTAPNKKSVKDSFRIIFKIKTMKNNILETRMIKVNVSTHYYYKK